MCCSLCHKITEMIVLVFFLFICPLKLIQNELSVSRMNLAVIRGDQSLSSQSLSFRKKNLGFCVHLSILWKWTLRQIFNRFFISKRIIWDHLLENLWSYLNLEITIRYKKMLDSFFRSTKDCYLKQSHIKGWLFN